MRSRPAFHGSIIRATCNLAATVHARFLLVCENAESRNSLTGRLAERSPIISQGLSERDAGLSDGRDLVPDGQAAVHPAEIVQRNDLPFGRPKVRKISALSETEVYRRGK